jgi:RNA polymerase sigma factor (sigma-70 family)
MIMPRKGNGANLEPGSGFQNMTSRPDRPHGERRSDAECAALAAAWLRDEAGAGDELARVLARHAGLTVESFLRGDRSEAEDLAQDTVVAVMGFIRRRGGFDGSLVHFTITVARNRCRNYLIWRRRHRDADVEPLADYLASPAKSPLDTLLERDVLDLLQQALARLGAPCRRLLRALYLEGRTVEEMRREAGLTTVQSIYYRRARCLREAGALLKKRLADCSSARDGAE